MAAPQNVGGAEHGGVGTGWFRNMGGKAKALGLVPKHQAEIARLQKEVRNRKYEFGVKLYDNMNMSRNMNRRLIGSKEEFQEVDAIFRHCEADIRRFSELRTEKNSALTKAKKPKAICYQHPDPTAGDSSTEGSEPNSPSGGGNVFQRGIQFGLQRAQSASQIAKLKSDLESLDQQIHQRKKQFGIDMHDTLSRLEYESQPRDPVVGGLYSALKKDISGPLLRLDQVERQLGHALQSGGMLISHDEIRKFIACNPSLWTMLEANIGYSPERCLEIAFRVAVELMSGKSGYCVKSFHVTKTQFKKFEKDYVNDPKGSQEFFHRSVFASFDADGNGVLDKEEIDVFLDTFYTSDSIFQGDARLPEKEELKKTILESLDENGDGVFTFDEIRSLITGSHALSTC